ncbi:hypothetical protein GGR28_003002 [Lewinella aquimaris]|uniref:DUF4412 domain-containing protein n=1 Tax=Neolewinella aquimaris TaxID=1835722 RepID=A0A840EEJ8_9BACT|nr:DUF4412 domain-containing protein [Neolewinella aquimaris]MBB4080368.1 hypothetical protein [Neolewinella aquimaris]
MIYRTLLLLLVICLCSPLPGHQSATDNNSFDPIVGDKTFSMVMTVTSTKKNGKVQVATMRLGAMPDHFAMIVMDDEQGAVSQMIYNTEDDKTTMITTDKKGRKQGFRMRMPKIGKTVAEKAEEMSEYITFTRTGERKTIDGYDCEKIIVTDSKHNTTTESWVTQDIDLSYAEVFGGIANLSGVGKQQFQLPGGTEAPIEGFLIQSFTDDGKSITETHITDIRLGDDIDRSLFDTQGVTIQELGF